MKYDEFRNAAHAAADWMADYLEDVGHRSILPDVAPGEVRSRFASEPPGDAVPYDETFEAFERDVVSGMTHWNHPGWFGYFPANHSPPSILAEMLVTAMGAQCMSWQTSPAATELEQTVMDWLRQMIGLPDTFTGVIQDTASSASLVALLSARERVAPGPGVPDDLIVYTSAEAHSSIDKAVHLSGIGVENLRKVAVDPKTFAMKPEALREQVGADLAAGLQPTAVIATIGTTSATGIDPVPALADICEEHDIWLHVDAAYAGSAAILPEMRWIMDGCDRADSFNFNPHKWLLTNFDCSAYWVRDVDHLVRTFSTSPEYLKTAHDAEVVNFRDWGIPLGRRFRALKLWFVIRSYGVSGLQAILRKHIAMAHDFRARVEEHPGLQAIGQTHFGLVCFKVIDGDEASQALLGHINASPDFYVTHTRLNGDYVIRVAIGQWQTEQAHVDALWRRINDALQD